MGGTVLRARATAAGRLLRIVGGQLTVDSAGARMAFPEAALDGLDGGRTTDTQFADVVRSNRVRGILAVQPWRLSERVTIQQGRFLCPGDLRLSALANWPVGESVAKHLLKIEIPNAVRVEGLGYLREHNISRATLFPGIDGFAQSLGHLLVTDTPAAREERAIQTALIEPDLLAETRVPPDAVSDVHPD